MNETYIIVGAHWGTFTAKDTGEVRGYAVLFCKAPFKESREGGNYHSMGEKTFQFKCLDYGVIKALQPGDEVELYFNQYEKVTLARLVGDPV